MEWNSMQDLRQYLNNKGIIHKPNIKELLEAFTQVNLPLTRVVQGEFNDRLVELIYSLKTDSNVHSLLSKPIINEIADLQEAINILYVKYLRMRLAPFLSDETEATRIAQISALNEELFNTICKYKINVRLSNDIINYCLNYEVPVTLFADYNKFRNTLEYVETLPASEHKNNLITMANKTLNRIYDTLIDIIN